VRSSISPAYRKLISTARIWKVHYYDRRSLIARRLTTRTLRGASLDYAQLEGASLGCKPHGPNCPQLVGASLVGTQLQGASLPNGQLQGASLDQAQLQGASLVGAALEGASLVGTQLQGASLSNAQLQGASLEGAGINATDFSDALLWRTNPPMPPSAVSAVRMSESPEAWLQPSADTVYKAVLTIFNSVPSGTLRDRALKRFGSLSCPSSDSTLTSCDPSVTPPPEAIKRHQILEAARVANETYATALAKTLKGLVCSGDDDAIYVVRGKGFQSRLAAAGAAASGMIDDLMNKGSKDCPVSASLTDADRAKLLRIKRDAENADK
jgi:uncharacterized protein YjbI with pentapeptide repeats